MLTILMKTKTFTVLANQRAFFVSRNTITNLKTIASGTNYVKLPQIFFSSWRLFEKRYRAQECFKITGN